MSIKKRKKDSAIDKEKINKLIFAAIDKTNENLPKKQRLKKSLDTPLFGPLATLDSLGIVNLIVNVEREIGKKCGSAIALADERAMSQKNSPFKTIGTLADYIYYLLKKRRPNG